MQFVGRVISSVSEFYRDINPSNLSGAIDVIVIEDEKTGELHCSPFHVRFGKGQVLMKPQDRKVDILVNGVLIEDLEMRIGEAGEAFFVEPLGDSQEDLPSRFFSSSPTDQPGLEAMSALLQSSPMAPNSPGKTLSDNETCKSPFARVNHENLSDSEIGYDSLSNKSPDWNWQWGDLPVQKLDEEKEFFNSKKYFDLISYLQNPIVIEKNYKRVHLQCSVKLILIQSPFKLFSSRELTRSLSHLVTLNTSKVLSYSEFSHDLTKLLDPSLLSHFVVRLEFEDSDIYFAGKVALYLLIALRIFNTIPELSELLRIAAEPLEEEPPKEIPQKTWRSWWSRSSTIQAPAVPDSIPKQQLATSPIAIKNTSIPAELALPPPRLKPKYLKSLRITSEKLRKMNLKYGENGILFSVGGGRAFCSSKIFLWKSSVKIVVSDIDGTITKSDALGHFFAIVGKDWTHSGVVNLYNAIHRNGYKFLYLTSRSIGQSSATQKYLRSVEQDKSQLPDGPIIMSPDRLFAALKREVILGNPQEFKIAALKDIKNLFQLDDPLASPFYAGFGNRITDAQSYHALGVPPSRIFTINASGSVWVEQLVMAGAASSSYLAITDIVDLYFPPVESAPRANDELYSEMAFWRTPMSYLEELGLPSSDNHMAVVGVGDDLFLIEGENGSMQELDDEEYNESISPFPYI